jgi:hypothetical protein
MTALSAHHLGRDPPGMADRCDLGLHHHLSALPDDEVTGAFPHHPGAVLGVLEGLDQTGDLGLVAFGQHGVDDRGGQGEVLDPLGCPVRRHLGRGHPPELLRVGLEERPVEPPAEARRDPALEVVLVLGRSDLHPQVRRDTLDRLDDAEVAQCIGRAKRVVEQLVLVIDPAHPRSLQEVFRGEDLAPQVLDHRDLREKAVPADVEAPTVPLDRAADAAHDVVGLQHRDGRTRLGERVRRGQARRARPDDDDIRVLRRHCVLPLLLTARADGCAPTDTMVPCPGRQ